MDHPHESFYKNDTFIEIDPCKMSKKKAVTLFSLLKDLTPPATRCNIVTY